MTRIKIDDLNPSSSEWLYEVSIAEATAINGGWGIPKFIKSAGSWVKEQFDEPIEAVVNTGLVLGGAVLIADGVVTGNPGAVYLGLGAVGTGVGVNLGVTW